MREGDLVRHTKNGREGWLHHIRNLEGDRERHDEAEHYGPTQEFDESWNCIVIWDDNKREQVSDNDLEVITPLIYVNVYLSDRAYGGPEEGGWWYNIRNVEQVFRCKDEDHAKQVYDQMVVEYASENRNRRADISSVLSEGRFEVTLEAWPGERSPSERPRYCSPSKPRRRSRRHGVCTARVRSRTPRPRT
jgi:hypothetical protein